MRQSILKFTPDYDEYLKDESRKSGQASWISFPKSEAEIIGILRYLWQENIRTTIQGARTGLTAGAVPQEGHILNLQKMNQINGLKYNRDKGSFIVSVQPGVLLADLNKAISGKDFDVSGWSEESLRALEDFKASGSWFFSPDPTETSASIGGMAACNASGARSLRYGPTRQSVDGLRIVLADGAVLSIRRGENKAQNHLFHLTTDSGRILEGQLPDYAMPLTKNAAGYYISPDMDLIDLFIGSEGTLGVLSEVDIRLLEKPEYTWGVMFFFISDVAAEFVNALREKRPEETATGDPLRPAAIEYFNRDAMNLLMRQKQAGGAFAGIPDIRKDFSCAVYVEFDGNSEEEIQESMMEAAERAELCGGQDQDTWVAATPQIMEQMKAFRHAVPEAVNMLVDQRRRQNPDITKLGTDMAVPDAKLDETLRMYQSDLVQSGLESVMFGHIGNNHVHVNILPRTMEEYGQGKALYVKWAGRILDNGGTVAAEHGIGKLKVKFLEMMYGAQGIQEMKAVKNVFDPRNILNIGNLFG